MAQNDTISTRPTSAAGDGDDNGYEPLHLPSGSRIGRYVVLEELGSGGMGVVYKAYDPDLDRGVALKLLKVKHKDTSAGNREATRMLREAQALAQLNHPNVVSVHDVGTVDDNVFVAMELIEGMTLNNWMQANQPSRGEALKIIVAAGRGLDAAHKVGLVHRDFKPENVIVGHDGAPRVIDFGLARVSGTGETNVESVAMSPDELADTETLANSGSWTGSGSSGDTGLSSSARRLLNQRVTQHGGILGTPFYMAPEQYITAEVNAQADQYSFSLVLHEILYSARPFTKGSLKRLRRYVKRGKLKPADSGKEVAAWLAAIVKRGLSQVPNDRYESMEALLRELTDDPEVAARQKRQARIRVGLVVGLVLVATSLPVAFWYEFAVRRSRLCQGATAQIAKVWNPGAKAELQQALIDTGVVYARDTAQRVTRSLDGYANTWANMHTETCQATRLNASQSVEVMDMRIGCLRSRLLELRILVEILTGADAKMVDKATQAATSLTSLETCADVAALQASKQRIKPPRDAETTTQVAAVRETLLKIKALDATGKYPEGLALAERVLVQATATGYLPVEAESLRRLGWQQQQLGQYEKAAASLQAAVEKASISHHDEITATAVADLVLVLGFRLAKPEEGLEWARVGAFAEYGPAVRGETRAQRLNSLGSLFGERGERKKALASYLEALKIREQTLGPEHPDVAALLNNIGNEVIAGGDYDRAVSYFGKALAIMEKTLGPEHPDVALALNNIGTVSRRQGKADEALGYFNRALAILERALGPDHFYVAVALNNLGTVHSQKSNYDTAMEYYRRSLAIRAKALGEGHVRLLYPLRAMADLLSSQGKHDKAIEHYHKALAIWQKSNGSESAVTAAMFGGLGIAYVALGRHRDALSPLQRAVRFCETKACDPEPRGQALFALAQTLDATHPNNERAVAHAKHARELLSKSPEPNKNALDEVDAWLQERDRQPTTQLP